MKISLFYFIICVTALSAILPGCDQDEIPPYTGVVINGPEEPTPPAPSTPPTAKNTADFMETASVEGTWQLIHESILRGFEYDNIDYRDSAIFYTFTVDEYSFADTIHFYALRNFTQKGNLTVRRGDVVEESVPYEYFFAYYNNPLAIPLEDTDYVPNMQIGDSILYCLRYYPGYLSLHSVKVNPKYGNREFLHHLVEFSKVE
jgi:hypothetical protein